MCGGDIDNRNFRRYRIESDCEIKIDEATSYHGTVVDFSHGVSAVFQGATKLLPGIQADIMIDKNGIQFKGEVIWKTDMAKGVRAGFNRVDKFKGSLCNFKLADVLIGLQRKGCTGILKVENETRLKKIYIEKGEMVFASSNNPEDRLGALLLKKGRITLKTYNEAASIVFREYEKFGRVLFDLGWKPQEVYRAICDQIEEIIVSLFALEEGTFDFQEGDLPSTGLITLSRRTENIIYRGIKRMNNFSYIKEVFSSDDAVLSLSPYHLDSFQDLSLDEDDVKILSLIDGQRSMNRIFSLSPLKDFDTMKTIFAFLSIGLIREEQESATINKIPIDSIMIDPLETESVNSVADVESLPKGERNRDYYSLLGLERSASQSDIQKAYDRFSQQSQLERHLHIASQDPKSELLKIPFNITDAYRTLSNPERRRKYDEHLAVLEMETGELPEVTYRGDAEQGKAHPKTDDIQGDRTLHSPKEEAPYLTGKRRILNLVVVTVVVCVAVILIFFFRGHLKDTTHLTASSEGEQIVRETSFPTFRHDAFQKFMSTKEAAN